MSEYWTQNLILTWYSVVSRASYLDLCREINKIENDIRIFSSLFKSYRFECFIADENYFRNFVLWLEDQKIRHYKIEDRAGLRNSTSSDWTKNFQQYLDDLGCPYQQSQRVQLIDWLLGYAVRLEYGDGGKIIG